MRRHSAACRRRVGALRAVKNADSRLAFATALVLWLCCGGTHALDEVELDIGGIEGPGWSSGAVTLGVRRIDGERVAASLRAAALSLPGPAAALRELGIECAEGRVSGDRVLCPDAELRVALEGGEAHSLHAPITIVRAGAGWRVTVEGVPSRGAHLALEARSEAAGWRLELRASGLDARGIRTLLGGRWPLPSLELAEGGMLAAGLVLGSDGAGAARIEVDIEASGLGFSDADGRHAAENLGAHLHGVAKRRGGDWLGRAELALDAGGLYVDPVFLDLGEAPVRVAVEGRLGNGGELLEAAALELAQAGVARASGTLSAHLGDSPAPLQVALELAPAALEPLYRTYLQPFLFASVLGKLRTAGTLAGRLEWRRGEGVRLQARLDGVDVEDRAGRFAVRGLDGGFAWDEGGETRPVSLSWSGGALYRLGFGAARIVGVTAGRDLYLERPVIVPALDGAIEIQALEARGLGGPALTWEFRGGVRKLSMQRLTTALGWPTFGGTVSGRTPRVRFAGGVVRVDGELGVRVFDGDVHIRNLSVRNPFGLTPVVHADVDVDDVSLHALTGAFSFGNIRGGLSGHVHGLVLQDWRPTAFDATFATPEDDDSPHRISQRAVRNLSRLGGAGAVLSSTVLNLFEEFSYRRLGLACRLRDGVCDMSGLADAEGGGFVIVEGGGLPPRIDVLGFNRRVDWEVLVARLKSAIEAPAPVVR